MKKVVGFRVDSPYHGLHELEMPVGALALVVSADPMKLGGLQIDALCPVEVPTEKRCFFVAARGEDVEADLGRFVGSIKVGPYEHFVFEAG
jgi:hypothetical protein